jgi:hypothetical protein
MMLKRFLEKKRDEERTSFKDFSDLKVVKDDKIDWKMILLLLKN